MKVDRKGPSVKKASRKVSTRDSRLLFQLGRIQYAINRQHQIDEMAKKPNETSSAYAASLRATDVSYKEWIKRSRERAARRPPRSVREPSLFLEQNPSGEEAPIGSDDVAVPVDKLLPDAHTQMPVRHPDLYIECTACKKPVLTSEAGYVEPDGGYKFRYWHKGCEPVYRVAVAPRDESVTCAQVPRNRGGSCVKRARRSQSRAPPQPGAHPAVPMSRELGVAAMQRLRDAAAEMEPDSAT